MMPQPLRPKVPGFHSYHQNLLEAIDWCVQEMRRQESQYAILRPRIQRARDLTADVRMVTAMTELSAVSREHNQVNEQLQRAVDDTAKVLPVYRLLRLLTKRAGLLHDIQNLLDS